MGIPKETQRELEPRPKSEPFMDIDRRRLYIPPGYIKPWMLEMPPGMEYGRYGTSRYGRCLYGKRWGLYGSDRYGSCSYS